MYLHGTGLPVVLPAEKESVLLGAAVLAASAAGQGEVMATFYIEI